MCTFKTVSYVDVEKNGVQVLSETFLLRKSQALTIEEPYEVHEVQFNVTIS
jgi:hypothetical protein